MRVVLLQSTARRSASFSFCLQFKQLQMFQLLSQVLYQLHTHTQAINRRNTYTITFMKSTRDILPPACTPSLYGWCDVHGSVCPTSSGEIPFLHSVGLWHHLSHPAAFFSPTQNKTNERFVTTETLCAFVSRIQNDHKSKWGFFN